jgi:hypothetical protein
MQNIMPIRSYQILYVKNRQKLEIIKRSVYHMQLKIVEKFNAFLIF